jgi:hypothetical protein
MESTSGKPSEAPRFALTSAVASAQPAARENRVMPGREIVVDADGHVCEPPDLWELAYPSLRIRDA